MNILYITGENIFLNNGGARHTIGVADALTKLGHKITVVCPTIENAKCTTHTDMCVPENAKLRKNNFSFKVIFFPLQIKGRTFLWVALLKLFKKLPFKFDVVMERYYFTGGVGACYAALKKIPYYLEVNNPHLEEFLYFNPVYEKLKPLLFLPTLFQLKTAENIFTITKKIIPPKFRYKTVEVSWGVEEKFINFKISKEEKIELKEKLNLKNNFVVGYVGSFQKWQGIKQLPAVIKKVITKNNQVIFILIGSGELLNWFNKKIKENNLQQNVRILGEIIPAELPKFISIFDLGFAPFFPSLGHPLQTIDFYYCPLKILEYLVLNKFVLTSDFKVLNKILQNGKYGKTVQPTVNNFAREIIKFSLQEINTSSDISSYVKQNFSWEEHCKVLLKYIK